MDGFSSAVGALRAAGTSLDVTSNNLANVNTPGFRSDASHLQTGPGGRGVEVGSITETNQPGPVVFTGRQFDLAATGDSFFAVRQGSGRLAFTKDGSFTVDSQGRLVNSRGDLLDPPITIPRDAQGVSIGKDGAVTAVMPDGRSQSLGRVEPVRFANSGGVLNIGGNLSVPTAASGPARRAAGSEVLQGTLTMSNVDIAEQMVNLLKDEKFSKVGVILAKTENENIGTVLDLKR